MDLYGTAKDHARRIAALENPQVVDLDAVDDTREDRIVELSVRLDELLGQIDVHTARLDEIQAGLDAVISGMELGPAGPGDEEE
jgi:hypothetical protein